MKITRTTDYRLSPADIDTMRRMRRIIPPMLGFAYINDHTCVPLATTRKTTADLVQAAREAIYLSVCGSQEYQAASDPQGNPILCFTEGSLTVLAQPGERFGPGELCEIGKLSCIAGDVLAIVTGKSAAVIDVNPADTDPDAPPRSYLQEMISRGILCGAEEPG